MIYLLAAIALTPVGSSTVHIYTRTIQCKSCFREVENFRRFDGSDVLPGLFCQILLKCYLTLLKAGLFFGGANGYHWT
jgi:hypothetical protein